MTTYQTLIKHLEELHVLGFHRLMERDTTRIGTQHTETLKQFWPVLSQPHLFRRQKLNIHLHRYFSAKLIPKCWIELACGYAYFSTSGFTGFSGRSPLSTAMMLPAAINAIFVRVPMVALPM
jgi:hypothetical protein